jgi:prefoldin subunit 5
MKTNYEKLVKGGDYAEESVKNFVETLKNELREVTEERDKFSALYEKLKQRSDELARKNRDQESKLKDLEE